MKYLILAIILLFLSEESFSQRYDDQPKFGVMTIDGEIVTKAIYDDVDLRGTHLDEPFVVVKQNGYQGVLGADGKQVGEVKYDKVSIFGRPMFEVHLNGKVGFMNTKGVESIPCIYDYHVTTDRPDSWYEMQKDEKCIVVDSLNNVVFPFDIDNFKSYENDGYTHNVALEKDGRWALANRQKELLTPFKYKKIELFHRGGGKASGDSAYYLLSPSGQEVALTKTDYQGIVDLDGLIAVGDKDRNIRLYNYKGEKLAPAYRGKLPISRFGEDVFSLGTENGWIVIDTLGNRLFNTYYWPPAGREMYGINFRDGIGIAKNKSGKHGVINKQGKIVIPFEHPNLESLLFFDNNYFTVRDGMRKIKILDINNKFISPETYDQAIYYKDAGIKVSKHGREGLISFDGKEIIPPIYDEVTNCKGGLVVLKSDEKIGFYSVRSGKKIDPVFDDWTYSHFGTNWVVKQGDRRRDRKYGVVSTDGEIVLPCEYTYIELTPSGHIIATNDDDVSAVMDAKGNILRPFGKEYLQYFRDNLLIFSE